MSVVDTDRSMPASAPETGFPGLAIIEGIAFGAIPPGPGRTRPLPFAGGEEAGIPGAMLRTPPLREPGVAMALSPRGPGRTGRLLPEEFPVEPGVFPTVPGGVPTLPPGVVTMAFTAFADEALSAFAELAAADELKELAPRGTFAMLCDNAPIWKVVGVP